MATNFITQHRRGTAAQWEESGIIPYNGEIVIEECPDGTYKTKIGDGVQTFTNLPYQNLDSELTELKQYVDGKVVDGLLYENNLLYLTLGGEIVSEPVEITGGSGGGGGAAYSVRILNGMSSNTLVVATSDKTMLTASFYEYYGEESTGVNGTLEVSYKLSTENTWTLYRKQTVAQGTPFSINVAEILTKDAATNIQFKITGGESELSRTLTYTITQVEASIATINFDSTVVYTGNISIQYRCVGRNLHKTVYFEIDGEVCDEIDVGTSHQSILSHTLQMMGNYAYGAHDLRIYFITSDGAVSNILEYTLLYNDGTDTQPMIGVVCLDDDITYGEPLQVQYVVYTPGQETTDELIIRVYGIENDNEVVYEKATLANIANNTQYTWRGTSYPLSGTAYVEFKSKNTIKTIPVTINEMQTEYNLAQVATNLVYSYRANGRSNNDAGKELYECDYTTSNGVQTVIEGTFEGFNWVSNGYVDGESLTLSGDARHTIKLPMFSTSYTDRDGQTVSLESAANSTVTTNGRTFEIEFKVSNVTDIEEHIIECMASDHAGFVVTPQNCYLLSANGSNVQMDDTGFIENEEVIAAAYIRDNKRIRLSFVIEPRGSIKYKLEDGTDMSGQCVNIYINGQYAKSHVYPDDARFFSQEYIKMGSNTCILNVYDVRIYNRGLSEAEILQNYNASPLAVQDKLLRFEDNDVLTDDGDVDYYKAIYKYPCLLATGPLSPYKGANGVKMEGKYESGWTLTKPDDNGGYTTELELLDKDLNGNWVSSNNVQGTSSQKFPLKNYKVYLAQVVYNEDGTPQTEVKDGVVKTKTKKVKYSLKGKDANGNDLSIGESTLCFKADYMSSDHANTFNANLADTLFDDVTESQRIDPRVQNTVWGFRCLLFRRDDIGAPIEFISDGALNNDKGNTKTFGLERDSDEGNDTTCQKWEFLNNTEALTSFQTDCLFKEVLVKDEWVLNATQALESTYPDQGDLEDEGLEPNYDYIQTLFTWVYQRANFWDASTEIAEVPYVYHDVEYYTEREYRKAIFISEFDKHFNKNHALIYYLFMEFVGLGDNRAKNMFLRSENVRVEQLLDVDGNEISIHDVIEEGTGIVDAERIDWENSTFAVWITDLYDLDSGFGVENSGYLRIPYYADWNYTLNGTPQFNGNGSRLWLMVEEALAGDIMAKAQLLTERGVGTGGLNYDTLYDIHIRNNALLVCQAVVNRDMTSKYSDPWVDGFIDYSMEGHPIRHISDYKYLQRGSRTEQKDAYIYRRSNMLYSKYKCKKFLNNNINFRCGVGYEYYPDVEGLPAPLSGISITANQVLYPAVMYNGEETLVSGAKTPAGEATIIAKANTSDKAVVGRSDTVFIAGGTFLTDIGDISKFKPYELQLQNATGLRSLHLGSDDENYSNAGLSKIDTSSCKLLEELNVMGCTALADLDLSKNQLLKRVYAQRSNIQSVTLPNGGVLQELHLGNISDLKILNQTNLSVFDCTSYDSLTKLHIENTPVVPVFEIIEAKLPELTNGIRLVGIDETIENASIFERLMGEEAQGKYIDNQGKPVDDLTKYPYISGKCHIGTLTGTQLHNIKQYYPDIEITYDTLTANVIYMNEDGTEELYRATVNVHDIIDPVEAGIIEVPTKEATAQYYFTYAGWSTSPNGEPEDDALTGIILDTVVYVAFRKEIRSYTVNFYNGAELLESQIIIYGHDAIYSGETPQKLGTQAPELYEFIGWEPSPTNVTSNVDCYAQYLFHEEKLEVFDLDDFEYSTYSDGTTSTLAVVEYIGDQTMGALASQYVIDGNTYRVNVVGGFAGSDVELVLLPITIEDISSNAFNSCERLISINIPEGVENIYSAAFKQCTQVTEIAYDAIACAATSYADRPFDGVGLNSECVLTVGEKVTNIPNYMFYNAALHTLVFEPNSACTAIGNNTFKYCNLQVLSLPDSLRTIGNNAFEQNTSIETLRIPEGVTTLGSAAFQDWQALTTLFIPSTVVSIGKGAFRGARVLENIIVDANNTRYTNINGCLVDMNNKELVAGSVNSIIPADGSVITLGDGCFEEMHSLTNVLIPDGITTIGRNAFSSCRNIVELTLSNTTTTIDSMAFYATGMTNIDIPASVQTLNMYAFGACPELTTVVFHGTPTTLNAGAFNSSVKIKDIYVPWAEGEVANAPWGATNATVHYNHTV